VTLRSASGQGATVGLINNRNDSCPSSPTRHVVFRNLTISTLDFGAASSVTFVGNRFTGSSVQRTPCNSAANVLFDSNSFDGITKCSGCNEGRITVRGYNNSVAVGVQFANNHFGGGGCSDGMQIIGGARGVEVGPNNEFVDLLQGNCQSVNGAHVDAIQLYGSTQTNIHGNYFHNGDSMIMAPDGGSGEQITHNVFVGGSYRPAIQLGNHNGDVFEHNTVRNIDVHMDSKSCGGSSNNMTARNNVMHGSSFGTVSCGQNACANCTITRNLFDSSGYASGTNNIIGAPSYNGGAAPASWTTWGLTAGSPGAGQATDGTDLGR
jgi:hypothetical protein